MHRSKLFNLPVLLNAFYVLLILVPFKTVKAQNKTDVDDIRIQQLYQKDLQDLQKLNFSDVSDAGKDFFGSKLSGKVLQKYISDRIFKVSYVPIENPSIIAEAINHVLTLHQGYEHSSFIQRIATIIHESRHAEAQNRAPHVFCPDPYIFRYESKKYLIKYVRGNTDFKKVKACDDNAHGAYAVQAAFEANVIRFCTNCTDDDKQEAYADFVSNGIFRIISEAAANIVINGNLGPEEMDSFQEVLDAFLIKN